MASDIHHNVSLKEDSLIYVVGELVITAKSDQGPQPQAVGEEDLCDRVDPNLRLQELGHVGHHVELYAFHRARKRYT